MHARESLINQRPYIGKTRKEIRDQLLSKQAKIHIIDIPSGWTIEAADFINRLIIRKPNNRLGVKGPDDIKSHQWFKDFKWDELKMGKMKASYIPNV